MSGHLGPNYRAVRGALHVTRDGEPVAVLHPEKRTYISQAQPMTEAAVHAGFTRDLYVALGEPGEGCGRRMDDAPPVQAAGALDLARGRS